MWHDQFFFYSAKLTELAAPFLDIKTGIISIGPSNSLHPGEKEMVLLL